MWSYSGENKTHSDAGLVIGDVAFKQRQTKEHCGLTSYDPIGDYLFDMNIVCFSLFLDLSEVLQYYYTKKLSSLVRIYHRLLATSHASRWEIVT